jgi:secreted Zn-dependent insulinase-like peptidase
MNMCVITTTQATAMQLYPAELAVAGPSLFYDYDPAAITAMLNHLTPQNMLLLQTARSYSGPLTPLREQWYGTEYSIEPLELQLLELWSQPGLNPGLHLPPANELVATDFELR